MTDKKLIVIVGITGNQGSSVAETFLSDPSYAIRGITRDPSKPSAQKWLSRGVTLTSADLNSRDSLVAAFRGATVIFAATDFLSGVMDPAVVAKLDPNGSKTILDLCFDHEVQHGRNLVDAAAQVLREEKKLERFVFSTLSGTRRWSKGTIEHNRHFDAKWEAVEYLRAKHKELDAKTSLLQMGLFMGNWRGGAAYAPEVLIKGWTGGPGYAPVKQPDGTYLISMPLHPDSLAPWVDPNQDTGPFTHALTIHPAPTNLLAYGSFISMKKWAAAFGAVHNVTCNYKQLPRTVLEERMPGGFGVEICDMYAYIDQFGYEGGDPSVVRPEHLSVKVKTTSIEEYLRTEDFSSILAG